MNKGAIIIGVAIVIAILGFVAYSFTDESEPTSVELIEEPENPEGKQFTLQLEDGISANMGP